MATVTRDQELELRIDSLAHGGRGVARHGELVVFVSRGLPGDRVRARVTRYKKRYAEARVVELLEPGPGRVQPVCSHFGVCGGCAWQDLDYAEQLRYKQEQVEDALRRLGRLDGFSVLPIVPAAERYGYRNKLEYSWTTGTGGRRSGSTGRGGGTSCSPSTTAISHPTARTRCGGPSSGGPPTAGWRRTTSARAPAFCAIWSFVRECEAASCWPCWYRRRRSLRIPRAWPLPSPESVVGVVHAVNDGVAEVTQGLPASLVYGRDWYEERIGGLRLNVSAARSCRPTR